MYRLTGLILTVSLVLLPSAVRAQWQLDCVALCAAANNQSEPTIVTDGAGGAIVTWLDTRSGTHTHVYAQRVKAGGVVDWTSNGVALSTTANSPPSRTIPTIVSDGSGGAIVAWSDYRSGTDYDIYARRVNASGVAQWTSNGVALSTAANDQSSAKIISDGAGGAIVTWQDLRSGASDIYAQRVTASGVVQWTAAGVAICTAANHQWDPKIISDGAGGAIVTWWDYRGGPNSSDVYAQRVDSSGAVLWTSNGVALCTAANEQHSPTIATDGAGGAIVTWYDVRSGTSSDIYAQRVDGAGVAQWMFNGVAICAAANEQMYPTIVSDGAGGVIATWWDYRGGTGYTDIYAQRINGSGVAQWTADGVALCTAANYQLDPTIASDGGGGAIVAWSDYRNGKRIYAQRVGALGVAQWTANGITLCTAVNSQDYPAIVSDASGGAIVAWQEYRSGTVWDIYAQRINASGSIPTGVGHTPPITTLTVLPNRPNPFSGTTDLEIESSAASTTEIEVYDVAGRRVRRMKLGAGAGGRQSVSFDGRDDRGRPLVSGVYFYRVRANGTTVTRKMVIAR
jgi:hypothetical protein